MTSVDIAEFISARLDDAQLWAEAALEGLPAEFVGDVPREQAFAMHILADVKAKRAIMAAYASVAYMDIADPEPEFAYGRAVGLGEAVRHLAATWNDHPDYNPEWSTDGTQP